MTEKEKKPETATQPKPQPAIQPTSTSKKSIDGDGNKPPRTTGQRPEKQGQM